MKTSSITVFSGIALLIPASIPLFLTGAPAVFAPLPALTIIPAFLLDSSHLSPIAVAIPTLLFFVWNPGLFRGRSEIPKRTYMLLLLATALGIAWFIVGWKLGLKYQGAIYTYAVCGLNAAWIALLGALVVRLKKARPSFTANLILNWLVFAWLGWFAFPLLGELP